MSLTSPASEQIMSIAIENSAAILFIHLIMKHRIIKSNIISLKIAQRTKMRHNLDFLRFKARKTSLVLFFKPKKDLQVRHLFSKLTPPCHPDSVHGQLSAGVYNLFINVVLLQHDIAATGWTQRMQLL